MLPGLRTARVVYFFRAFVTKWYTLFQAFLGQVAWFFLSADGLVFFKHWPTFFLTFATVLDQLYQAYAESHESDPPEISEGFKELECFLETLPLDDNNAVFNLCCRLCTAYEEKAFRHGLLYGAHLMSELQSK